MTPLAVVEQRWSKGGGERAMVVGGWAKGNVGGGGSCTWPVCARGLKGGFVLEKNQSEKTSFMPFLLLFSSEITYYRSQEIKYRIC